MAWAATKRWLIVLATLVSFAGHVAVAEDEIPLDKERVNFVIANTMFVLLHELAHGIIHQYDIPVLGEEEDAADTIASIILLNAERLNPEADSFATLILLSAGEGHKLTWETGIEQEHIDLYYWARHPLSIRRFHRIACLVYGSDPERFEELPERIEMPEFRADSCEDEYELAERSVAMLIEYARQKNTHETQNAEDVPVARADTEDSLGRRLDQILQETGALRKLFNAAASVGPLPADITVSVEDCEFAGAYWDPDDNELLLCYQLLSMFYELAENQNLPALLRERQISIPDRT